jgi:hypothetical protein
VHEQVVLDHLQTRGLLPGGSHPARLHPLPQQAGHGHVDVGGAERVRVLPSCVQHLIWKIFRLKLLWLTLTQPYSYCEIEFLPVYTPNEEEKRDPKLFANNVRAVMAKYVVRRCTNRE